MSQSCVSAAEGYAVQVQDGRWKDREVGATVSPADHCVLRLQSICCHDYKLRDSHTPTVGHQINLYFLSNYHVLKLYISIDLPDSFTGRNLFSSTGQDANPMFPLKMHDADWLLTEADAGNTCNTCWSPKNIFISANSSKETQSRCGERCLVVDRARSSSVAIYRSLNWFRFPDHWEHITLVIRLMYSAFTGRKTFRSFLFPEQLLLLTELVPVGQLEIEQSSSVSVVAMGTHAQWFTLNTNVCRWLRTYSRQITVD